jgi:hypothetical protein
MSLDMMRLSAIHTARNYGHVACFVALRAISGSPTSAGAPAAESCVRLPGKHPGLFATTDT